MLSPTKITARAMLPALGLSLLACSSALAQIVVINARGPSAAAYPQGSVLAPGRMITLKAGDQLEVLDAAGSHVLVGPKTIPASQVDTGTQVALQDIFRKANASRPGIAAVRGFSLEDGKTSPTPETPPLWRLDVTAWQQEEPKDGHDFCVMSGQPVVLSRGDYAVEGKLTIFQESTKASRTVTWPAGVRDLPWPSDLTTADGAVYDLNLNAAGATSVRWRDLPPGERSLTALAKNLVDNGCYDQIDTLQTQFAAK